MRYIAITYNYLTLGKALVYAKNVWGCENTQIIFLPTVSDLNTDSFKELDIIKVGLPKIFHHYGFISDIRQSISLAKNIVSLIDKLIENHFDDDFTFIVFKDSEIRNCCVINSLKKKYRNSHIILMEEGMALYSLPRTTSISVKSIIRSSLMLLCGVPKYFIENHPMGCNPAINRIICSNPDALKKRGVSKNAVLEKEIDVFSRENCDYLLKNLFKINFKEHIFDYVFLTQPIYPRSKVADAEYDKFLKELFSVLTKNGSVLIKRHPRDKWDYSSYKNENVEISENNVSHIPFECIMGVYGRPQMLTLFSSAAFNSLSNKKSIFLYKLLPGSLRAQIDEQLIKNSNSVICESFSELSTLLKV